MLSNAAAPAGSKSVCRSYLTSGSPRQQSDSGVTAAASAENTGECECERACPPRMLSWTRKQHRSRLFFHLLLTAGEGVQTSVVHRLEKREGGREREEREEREKERETENSRNHHITQIFCKFS